MAKSISIEDGFAQLQGLMEQMEADGVTLEESFQIYSKSVKLVKQLKNKLDDTEKKLIVLQEGEQDEGIS